MTQTTLRAEEAFQAVQSQAETICSNKPQRFPAAASVGDSWRQGDVYFTLLDRIPDGYVLQDSPQLQLAPGTTKGSRHCLESLDGVKAFASPRPSELEGPVLQCGQEKTITHPEHGHLTLPPGIYRVSYQQDERRKRVQD